MNLILVADNPDNSKRVEAAATGAGYRVVKQVGPHDDTNRYIEQYHPDGMIVISDEMDRETLSEMRAVTAHNPLPIVVLTSDSTESSIDSAVRAGASAYVVNCEDDTRIGSLMRVAQTRFKEQQILHKELHDTKNALYERKQVEKAKGIIMKQKNMSEDQAYKAMRKLAMNHNKRIADIAGQVIAAAEVLI